MKTIAPMNDKTSSQDTQHPILPYGFSQRRRILVDNNDNQQNTLFFYQTLSPTAYSEACRFLNSILKTKKISADEFQKKLTTLHQSNQQNATDVVDDIGSSDDLNQLIDEIPVTADLLDTDNDAPVIRLINALLTQAIQDNASDIHIEPFEEKLCIRFRIDGILQDVISPQKQLAPLLISRLKVMARLDIAEKRIPQDGRISIKIAGHPIDIRLSTIPAVFGERIVLRILDKKTGLLQLPDLHMGGAIQQSFEESLHAPHGIILVTGPTGSGKTTTLYSGLSLINQSSRNIMTVEDPVEYILPGIAQTPVNPKVNMSFAKGLRAILRQDPDVVMIGEIRDLETAEIAIQASLTGHLVLSTLHTNTAIGAITRLQDMGVEPFLLSSSLNGVMAQRLIRLLCPHCKQSYQADNKEAEFFNKHQISFNTLYKPVGCSRCHHTGFQGRTGIYEWVPINDELRQLIHNKADEATLTKHARMQSLSIQQHGLTRVANGESSLSEIIRVSS